MTLKLFCRRGESAKLQPKSSKRLREPSLLWQAKSANHFGGCGESTRFTTREQQEAAEQFLLWQAKSSAGRSVKQNIEDMIDR